MPELPEVETIVRSLRPALVGRRIDRVDVRERRLRVPIADDLPARLAGRRIVAIGRHAKFLLATLDDERCLLVHLGMTGRLTLGPATRLPLLHDHVVFHVGRGQTVVYNDPRRFGRIDVVAADAVARETVTGIDALDPALTSVWLHARARGRRTSVKALLMDQRVVAGLGNIYVSEICFHAGIRPRRAAGRLRLADCARLVVATRAVLDEAIARGGSSISDYRDGFGGLGSYQDRHAVYDREGEPCLRCGTPVRAAVVSGRSTFWCPRCQQ